MPMIGLGLGLALHKGVGAPPWGFAFVTYRGQPVTYRGQPVIVRIVE